MQDPDIPWWGLDISMKEVVKAEECLKMNNTTECDVQPQHVKYKACGLTLYLSTGFTIFLRHSFVLEQYECILCGTSSQGQNWGHC